jgi:hypothetical protein
MANPSMALKSKMNGKKSESATTSTPTLSPTPTITATPTMLIERTVSVTAAPNISRNGEPIQFRVELPKPFQIRLSLFTLLGEQIFQVTSVGNAGLNNIDWPIQNLNNVSVASGLYIYSVEVNDGSKREKLTGKVLVIR